MLAEDIPIAVTEHAFDRFRERFDARANYADVVARVRRSRRASGKVRERLDGQINVNAAGRQFYVHDDAVFVVKRNPRPLSFAVITVVKNLWKSAENACFSARQETAVQ